MRTILPYALVLIALTSCSKYQFVTVNSDLEKLQSGMIVLENDTAAISYAFSGPDGPVRIQVINKLSIPLYVRWKTSTIEKQTWPNTTLKPLFTAALETNVDSQSPEILEHNSDYSLINNPEEIIKISGNGVGNSEAIQLRKAFFHVSTPDMKTGELNGGRTRTQIFNRQNTPLQLISELSFSITNDFKNKPISKHEFWVDEVLVTMVQPKNAYEFKKREDVFYLRKGSGFGFFLASIGFFTYFAASRASD